MSATTIGKRSSPWRRDQGIAHARPAAPRCGPTRITRAPSAASASVAARPRPGGGAGDEGGPAGQGAIRRRRPSEEPATEHEARRGRSCRRPSPRGRRPRATRDPRSLLRVAVSAGPAGAGGRMTTANHARTRRSEPRMTRLHEQIETTLPIDDVFAFVADFANSMVVGPGHGDVGAHRRRARGRRRPLPARRPDARPASSRWSTGSRPSSRRAGSSSTGAGSGVSAVDEIRFEPIRDGHPRSTTRPTSAWAACMRLVAAVPGRRVREDRARTRSDGMQRALDARARSREPRPPAIEDPAGRRRGTPMKVAVVGSGVSGLTAAYALHRRRPRGPPVRARAGRRRARRHRRRPHRPRPGRGGHRLHRLQRAAPTRASSGLLARAGRGDAAERHVVRLGLPRLRRRVRRRAARAASSPQRGLARPARRTARMFPDILRFYRRRPRGSSTRAAPTGDTLGEYLDEPRLRRRRSGTTSWSRSPPRSGPRRPSASLEFPVDYLLHFLDNHGLIGSGQGAAVADVTGAARTSTWTGSLAALPDGVGARRRARRRASRATPAGVTVRTAGGAARAVRRRRHRHARRRRAGAPARRRRRRAGRPWAASTTRRNQVVLHTDERVMPRRPRRVGVLERGRSRPATRPARSVTMTYHMNRLQSLPGPTQYFVSLNPGDAGPRRPGDPGPRVQPPAVHVPDARGPGATCAPPGPPADLVRGRAPRLRLPRGRLPLRLRGGRAALGVGRRPSERAAA